MNDKQFYHIESPALCSALQAWWIPSNMQRDIVSGPLSSLGLNNRTIFGTQGLKHIMAIMNFDKTDSVTGKQLRASLESTKLEVGWSGPLFTNNYPSLSNCITDNWISNTRKFLWEYNLVLEGKTTKLEIQRLNDSLIMEDFLKDGLEGTYLAELNRWILFLKVACLSDISTWMKNPSA